MYRSNLNEIGNLGQWKFNKNIKEKNSIISSDWKEIVYILGEEEQDAKSYLFVQPVQNWEVDSYTDNEWVTGSPWESSFLPTLTVAMWKVCKE